MRFRSIYDYNHKENDIESVITDDCRVVPNCSLSVKEILHRFECGTLVDTPDSRYFDDDDDDIDSPVLSYTDLTDLSDNQNKIDGIVNKIKQTSKKAESSESDSD